MGCGSSSSSLILPVDSPSRPLVDTYEPDQAKYEKYKAENDEKNAAFFEKFKDKWFSMEFASVTDSPSLSKLGKKLIEAHSKKRKSSDGILELFTSIGLASCEDIIVSLGVTYEVLYDLSDDDLKNELKIESGIKRKQVLTTIQNCKLENEKDVVRATQLILSDYLEDLAAFFGAGAHYQCLYQTSPEFVKYEAEVIANLDLVKNNPVHRTETFINNLIASMIEAKPKGIRDAAANFIPNLESWFLNGSRPAGCPSQWGYLGMAIDEKFQFELKAHLYLCSLSEETKFRTFVDKVYDTIMQDATSHICELYKKNYPKYVRAQMFKVYGVRFSNTTAGSLTVSSKEEDLLENTVVDVKKAVIKAGKAYAISFAKELVCQSLDLVLPGSGTLLKVVID